MASEEPAAPRRGLRTPIVVLAALLLVAASAFVTTMPELNGRVHTERPQFLRAAVRSEPVAESQGSLPNDSMRETEPPEPVVGTLDSVPSESLREAEPPEPVVGTLDSVPTERPQSSPSSEPVVHTYDSLLDLGDRVLQNEVDAYPEAIFQLDWAANVPKRDVLHLGALQRTCTSHKDAIITWTYASESDPRSPNVTGTLLGASDAESAIVETLRKCAVIDIYLPEDLRGQGYCEDASAYANYLHARLLPDWVFKRTFYDNVSRRSVTYHELCPKTPLLFFNHYWNGIRDRNDWPATKPLYLMPNIEMYELEAKHYLQADLILCKTAVCTTYLTKWLAQEGNPRMTQVLYTRFTSSDVATNALVSVGTEQADGEWGERSKNFGDVVFTHTAGTSFWKGTRKVLDCWITRPDLPPLNLYMDKESYDRWYKNTYGARIANSANIKLHTDKLDAVSFGRMIADSAFFLCTSEMEGYGHYINQARASGGLIVTSNAPPMHELITPQSGVIMNSSRTSHDGQFLGATSRLAGSLRNVPGFVAAFTGTTVCDAADVVVRDLDRDERNRRAHRARQQFFYDTAFFAAKMQRLRETIRPHS